MIAKIFFSSVHHPLVLPSFKIHADLWEDCMTLGHAQTPPRWVLPTYPPGAGPSSAADALWGWGTSGSSPYIALQPPHRRVQFSEITCIWKSITVWSSSQITKAKSAKCLNTKDQHTCILACIMAYFGMYNALLCILHTHVFLAQTFRKKFILIF